MTYMPPTIGVSPSPRFSQRVHSLGDSDSLRAAAKAFCQQLQVSIRMGRTGWDVLSSVLSASSHLGPFEVMDSNEDGFLWLADILSSRYPEGECHAMASRIVQLLGERFYPTDPDAWEFPSSWIPPLLDFLSLCDKLYHAEGLAALRILSSSCRYSDFGARILPVLTSILLPTHPLQSRVLALKIFYKFAAGWFASQMENTPPKDLGNFLQAVGDPFQFPDHSTRDGRSVDAANYEPMEVAVILIEFASSNLWRGHLCYSNFSSCEGILSTEEGRRAALESMFHTATHSRSELLRAPAEIFTAIKRLEELQCPNTAEVVILWAWTVGVVNVANRDGWGSIERNTLDFYQTDGIGRLTALSRHITEATMEFRHLIFLLMHYRNRPCRVWSVERPLPYADAVRLLERRGFRDLRVAQVCRLRRLYHLFGYDPMTWKEAVAVEEVDEEMDVFSGQSATPILSMDWACDYP